jgi:hypothetical protein
MPPKTADAADAWRSVRREKLIGFSLEGYCSCDDPSRVIRVLARLLQRPHAAATQALADQDCLGQQTPVQPPGWLGLLEDSPKYLI